MLCSGRLPADMTMMMINKVPTRRQFSSDPQTVVNVVYTSRLNVEIRTEFSGIF